MSWLFPVWMHVFVTNNERREAKRQSLTEKDALEGFRFRARPVVLRLSPGGRKQVPAASSDFPPERSILRGRTPMSASTFLNRGQHTLAPPASSSLRCSAAPHFGKKGPHRRIFQDGPDGPSAGGARARLCFHRQTALRNPAADPGAVRSVSAPRGGHDLGLIGTPSFFFRGQNAPRLRNPSGECP